MAGNPALRELTGARQGAFVDVAGAGDGAGLRALLRQGVMPGTVRLAMTREPDFFAADGLAGAEDVTVVARQDGAVSGMGRVSVLRLMKNGSARRIGYVGSLRVAPGLRESPRLIRAGYDLLARETPAAEAWFTSIAADNHRARTVLEKGTRFGIPAYRALCALVTLVAPARAAVGARGGPAAQEALSAFLAAQAARYHLALSWDDRVWTALRHHGLSPDDFVVVRQHGAIVAAGAVWDQRAFRQVIVDGYDSALRWGRPAVNLVLRLSGRSALPAPGSVLRSGSVFGAFVREPGLWAELWPLLQARAAASGLSWITLARDARDPELAVLRRIARAREYGTTLYDIALNPDVTPASYDRRWFRPEVALL